MRQRMDTLFGGNLPRSGPRPCQRERRSQSQLEQAIRVLEKQHQEAEDIPVRPLRVKEEKMTPKRFSTILIITILLYRISL